MLVSSADILFKDIIQILTLWPGYNENLLPYLYITDLSKHYKIKMRAVVYTCAFLLFFYTGEFLI